MWNLHSLGNGNNTSSNTRSHRVCASFSKNYEPKKKRKTQKATLDPPKPPTVSSGGGGGGDDGGVMYVEEVEALQYHEL